MCDTVLPHFSFFDVSLPLKMREISFSWLKRYFKGAREDGFLHAYQREQYWTVLAFDQMVARCDDLIFLEPSEGLKCAEILVRFSRRVRNLDPERQGFAFAVLGSALRATGRFEDARESYSRALTAVRTNVVRGLVLQRLAVLELLSNQKQASRKAIEESIVLLKEGQREDLGTSFAIRASIHAMDGRYMQSVNDNALALELVHCGSRSYFCALRNLGDAMVYVCEVDSLSAIFILLKEANAVVSKLNAKKRRVPRALLRWVEGRLWGRLGSHRKALRLLELAQKTMLEVGETSKDYFKDALIVGVDIAAVLDAAGDFSASRSELREIARLGLSKGWKEVETMVGDVASDDLSHEDLRLQMVNLKI